MIDDKMIARINELARKSKQEGLTEAEIEEQKALRLEYVLAFRKNLRSQLESIVIKNPDGSLTSVKERHDKIYGAEEDDA